MTAPTTRHPIPLAAGLPQSKAEHRANTANDGSLFVMLGAPLWTAHTAVVTAAVYQRLLDRALTEPADPFPRTTASIGFVISAAIRIVEDELGVTTYSNDPDTLTKVVDAVVERAAPQIFDRVHLDDEDDDD